VAEKRTNPLPKADIIIVSKFFAEHYFIFIDSVRKCRAEEE
jgi:predicted metallo-beta-lactamase superfamily hydrolase